MNIIHFDSISYIPASHEDPKDPGVVKKVLLKRDELAGGRVQMINWAKLGVGKTFRPHAHEDMQEIFIIVKGTASMTIDKESETMHAGDCVVIPPKGVHEMTNIGNIDVEYVVMGIALVFAVTVHELAKKLLFELVENFIGNFSTRVYPERSRRTRRICCQTLNGYFLLSCVSDGNSLE